MKRFVLMLFAFAVMVACGRQTPATEESNPKTSQINLYVQNVVDSLAYYCYVNSNADSTKQVSVIYRDRQPVMLTTSSSVMLNDEMYILSDVDGSVVYMHEAMTDPVSYVRVENQFYYENGQLIRAETKSDTGWVAYVTQDSLSDYRLHHSILNANAASLILEAESDRPRLNAAGNAARRQGALYWVEGNQPFWSASVTPNQNIVLVLNNGAEQYRYPVFAYDKLDEYVSRYHGIGEDGHEFELVLSDISNASNDLQQGKVNAQLTHKGNVYSGYAVNLMDF